VIAVIFEVEVAPGQRDGYLDMAAAMRAHLAQIDGFVSVERFESLTTPGKLLSLSVWEDEAALDRWRQLPAHRCAQAQGRDTFFTDYRLRVAGVIRDYGMTDRVQAPADSIAALGI
jgi:heme-degrading monooxygenase HmoA